MHVCAGTVGDRVLQNNSGHAAGEALEGKLFVCRNGPSAAGCDLYRIQCQRVEDPSVYRIEGVALENDVSHPVIVQVCKRTVDGLNPVDIAIQSPKDIAGHVQTVNKMIRSVWLDDNEGKPRGNVIAGENIVRNTEAAKRKLV